MRLRVSLVVVGLLALMGMVLAACGSPSSGGGNIAPDSKQVLHYPIDNNSSDLATLDPARTSDFYSQQVQMLIFPPLMALDDNLNTVPFAAASAPTVSADGLTYTFKIKPGLKWSDGTPIDASTYAYSLNRSLDPCTLDTSGSSFLYAIKGAPAFNQSTCDAPAGALDPVDSQTLIGKSIVATDPQTLVITLGAPAAYFPAQLTPTQAFAQPEQLITRYGLNQWTSHLTDNGGFSGSLYKLTAWSHTGTLTLDRNDAWTGGPKPKLREIDITIYKLAETSVADYTTGKLDTTGAVGGIPSSQYPVLKTKADFHEAPFLDMSYLQPNWSRAPFNDLRARQAFALAINKDALDQHVLNGAYIPTNHIVPKGDPGYYSGLQGVLGAGTTGNPQQAQTLIQQYAADKCGGQVSKCTPVTFVTSNTTANVRIAQALLQMWQTAMPGYPITISNVDFNTVINDVYGQSSAATVPQIYALGYALDYPDPQDWLSLQFSTGSSNNVTNVTDPTAQQLMVQCDTTQPPQRYTYCNQAEQSLVNQVAWIVTGQQKALWETHSNVHGYTLNGSGMPSLLDWENTIYITQ